MPLDLQHLFSPFNITTQCHKEMDEVFEAVSQLVIKRHKVPALLRHHASQTAIGPARK